jgi:aspartokinase
MPKVRLGGIKAFEKRAYLTALWRSGGDVLEDMCLRLASDRINLNLLTHIAGSGGLQSITAACTEDAEGFSRFVHWKVNRGECDIGKLLSDVSIISVFPHDQKLNVTGALMHAFASGDIRPYGFASSPSAITMLVSSSDFEAVIYGLFDAFEFPTYSSPLDWHAAYRGQEELLSEIVCSYQEDLIKVYNLTHHNDLDLLNTSFPPNRLADFGAALFQLDELHLRIPFLVSKPSLDGRSLIFAFCLSSAYRGTVMGVLEQNLPGLDLRCHGPVSVFFLHGPHFGDRYGIANTLVRSLSLAGISPLALSCTVSSISVVIEGDSIDAAIEALKTSFHIPAIKRYMH